jgi:GTPase SAR1 family protein
MVPKVVFDCWDFAGQEVFYSTHQYFISRKAIYLIVFNAVLTSFLLESS